MFNFPFLYTLILLVLMTILLVKEILDPDIVIFSSLLLLTVGRVVTIQEAFVGFSNSGMLTVGFLFIVAKALQETGMLNQLGNIFLGNTKKKRCRSDCSVSFSLCLLFRHFLTIPRLWLCLFR